MRPASSVRALLASFVVAAPMLLALSSTADAGAGPTGDGRLAVTIDRGSVDDRTKQVWTLEPDGTGLKRRFAAIEEFNQNPILSPDGEWVAFQRNSTELRIARLDGSAARTLGEFHTFQFVWSPDGTRIAFISSANNQEAGIWIVNAADGSSPRKIYQAHYPFGLDWSPRGDKLAFSQIPRGKENPDLDSELFVINADGTGLTQLTDNVDPNRGHTQPTDSDPEFSPDGSHIAFVSSMHLGTIEQCKHGCPQDLYTVDVDGSNLQRHPGPEYYLNMVTWSPDGSEIAYLEYGRRGGEKVGVRTLATDEIRHVLKGVDFTSVDWGPKPGTVPLADLAAVVLNPLDETLVGGSSSFEAVVINQGPATARDAALEVLLPAGASLTTGGDGASCGGEVILRCPLGDLAAGARRTVSLEVVAGQAAVQDLDVRATSITPDPNFENNAASSALIGCSVMGTGRADRLVGTNGDDVLCGAAGDDVLIGRGGDDVLIGGSGHDTLKGGTGTDTASYVNSSRRIVASLRTRRTSGAGNDRLRSLENLVGGSRRDTLTGDARANVLDGGGGNDILSGLGGRDNLRGGAGADRLLPGGGKDTVAGGPGADLLDYAALPRRVKVNLRKGLALADGPDRIRSVEGVIGTRAADRIVGSVVGDRIFGGGGADLILGAGGDDRISGGHGRDSIAGGDGNDAIRGGPGKDSCVQDFGRGPRRTCEG